MSNIMNVLKIMSKMDNYNDIIKKHYLILILILILFFKIRIKINTIVYRYDSIDSFLLLYTLFLFITV